MTATAIFETAQALRSHIGTVLAGGVNDVHIGAPIVSEMGQKVVSLFPFHIEVSSALRNEPMFDPPPVMEPATNPVRRIDMLPLDVKFLITVLRSQGAMVVPPNELIALGRIVELLQREPDLVGENLDGRTVRVTPEPYPMEEMSRIWGLFGSDVYRTSMVYLASPVIIKAQPLPAGVPVVERTQVMGADSQSPGALSQAGVP